MGYEEKLQESPGTGPHETAVVPPQRSESRFDSPPEEDGGGWLTTRLVILSLTIILLGTAAGLVGALVLPKTYGARAEILYSNGQGQQGGGDPLKQDRQLSTQLVYLQSRAVLGPIAQKQGRDFKDLTKDVSVAVLDNSDVIQVEAHGATKLAAMQTLQAIMDGYMTLIGQPTGVSRNLSTQLADAHTNTTQLQTQVQQLTTAVTAGTATQASLNDARAQLDRLPGVGKGDPGSDRSDQAHRPGRPRCSAADTAVLDARRRVPAAADRGRHRCTGRIDRGRWGRGDGCLGPDVAWLSWLWYGLRTLRCSAVCRVCE